MASAAVQILQAIPRDANGRPVEACFRNSSEMTWFLRDGTHYTFHCDGTWSRTATRVNPDGTIVKVFAPMDDGPIIENLYSTQVLDDEEATRNALRIGQGDWMITPCPPEEAPPEASPPGPPRGEGN